MPADQGVRESVTVAGRGDRVRVARAFAAALLGPGHPCEQTVTLLTGELVANSVRHSGSGAPGETVTVTVTTAGGTVRVEVTDRSSSSVPALRAPGADAEGGRGLQMVDSLAAAWGYRQLDGRTTTWFEVRWQPLPASPAGHAAGAAGPARRT
jgi:anti-sigma regulatory factor (Ser/Thr protein kinase)